MTKENFHEEKQFYKWLNVQPNYKKEAYSEEELYREFMKKQATKHMIGYALYKGKRIQPVYLK